MFDSLQMNTFKLLGSSVSFYMLQSTFYKAGILWKSIF